MPADDQTAPSPSDNAFSYPGYRNFFIGRTAHAFAMQIIATAVGWQIYDLTGQAVYLAWVGLAVFIPVLLLVLPSGYVADHFDRRLVSVSCFALEACAAAGLLLFSISQSAAVWPVYLCLAATGVASSFGNPAASSLVPNVLSKEALPHGIAVNSMSWQTASILGPTIGGLLVWASPNLAYGISLAMLLIGLTCTWAIGQVPQQFGTRRESMMRTLMAGFHYILKEPVVLGAISLDLFSVLLGGAVALLPIYAKDILHLEAWGNGMLRAASGAGAVLVGLALAKFGIKDRAGWWMFAAVALDGLVIVVFGYSTTAWLSVLMLALYGAFDMISVYVRETLMQIWIPDQLRGRVNAVNNVFIGASNQLGEARAGYVAAFFGAVPAVVMGGFGTFAVAVIWSLLFPKLRDARRLTAKE